jgi:cell division protein FtsB
VVVNRTVLRWQRAILIAVLATGTISYFGWHAHHGNYGIFARERLDVRVAELARELADVRAERQAMERRVSLLKAQSLDPDILEERARESLGLAHPNDVVILQRPNASSALQQAPSRR